MPRLARGRGFTLLEVVVVLIVLCLAAILVVPALLSAKHTRPGLGSVIPTAREVAARRGEVVYLRFDGAGNWRLDGAASGASGPLAAGRVDSFPGLPLTLVVSPIGSCGFDPRSAGPRVIRLDPLTCEVAEP